MTDWYCYSCPSDSKSKYLGPWGDDDKEFFRKIKQVHETHEGFSTNIPEKTIEQLGMVALRQTNPLKKMLKSKSLKKQNLLEDVVDYLQKEVLKEQDNLYLVLLNGLSAYSSNPINLRILAPSSEGKTYLVNKVSKLFPKPDVLNLSTASAQSFKYGVGEMVIEDENGNFESIEPQLIDLEMQYLDKSNSKERESIRRKIAELKRKSWHMIDLSNKWLIFSDSQDAGLWEMLKTLLSHDDEYIKHQVTNKIGGKNTAQRIVFKGKPAVTYCSAKDESKHQVSEEMDSRFHTVYLKTNPAKYQESIKLLANQHGLPESIYESEFVSKNERLESICKLNLLIENMVQYGSSTNQIFDPYAEELAKNFPSESGFRSRQFNRFCQYITMITLCYSSIRPKLRIDGNFYPVVTKSDIIKTTNLMKESANIPTSKIQFFNDCIRSAIIDIQDKEEFKVDLGSGSKYVMTASELSDYVKSKYHKVNLDRKKILENYLEPLSEHGYLEMAQDPRNRTRNIYWLAKPYQDKKAGMESTLIDISTVSDSGGRVYIEKRLKRRFDSGELTILNGNNKEISLDDLYKTITSIDIQTPKNRHDSDNVETSTDVEDKQPELFLGTLGNH